MLSPNLLTRRSYIRVNPLPRDRYSPGLCRFCADRVCATYTVEHCDLHLQYVSDYCCYLCAVGWLQIKDSLVSDVV